jgi:hypothetical protein
MMPAAEFWEAWDELGKARRRKWAALNLLSSLRLN